MPYHLAAGNSAGTSYAGGRLDEQVYARAIGEERGLIEDDILAHLWLAFADEAALVPGLLPNAGPFGDWDVGWYWPGFKHVDPYKEAKAQHQRLEDLTTTLEDEWAEQGEDWERKLEQIAAERKKMQSLGLVVADAMPRSEDLRNGPSFEDLEERVEELEEQLEDRLAVLA